MSDEQKKKVFSDQWGPDPSATFVNRSAVTDHPNASCESSFAEIDPADVGKPVDEGSIVPSVESRAAWSSLHSNKGNHNSGTDFLAWRRLWEFLTGPATIALMALTLGLLGFFIITRLLELYATIASLAVWEAWFAVSLLAFCTGAILASVGYFILAYRRLRRNRQIHLSELATLGQRTSSKRKESMDSLTSYLESFALDDSLTLPISEDTRSELREAKQRLLGEWRMRLKQMPDQWLSRFVEVFQDKLDDEANGRVAHTATLVAFKTAVSPNPLLDTAIVLFWSFKLLGDLCRIYNLRVGTFGTAALLSRVLFVAYVAGRLDDWEEHAEENLEHVLENLPAPDLAKNIVGRIGAKTGAGLANYFLVRRLGKRAIEMLRPVRT